MNRQCAFLVSWLVVFAVGENVGGEKQKIDSYIVNGNPIDISEVPYIVQLRTLDGFFLCGGSLIATDTVISAAHCMKNKTRNDIVIVAGTTYSSGVGVQRRVTYHAIPQGYNFNNPMSNEDIVIFTLDRHIPVTENIKPIALCDKPMNPGEMVQISGWGAQYSGGRVSSVLQTIRVPVIDIAKCQQLYSNFAPVYGSMVCAGNLQTYQDACQGDSGGPLAAANKLCGVTSWGRGCARSDSPGVYTSINAMINFILQYMAK